MRDFQSEILTHAGKLRQSSCPRWQPQESIKVAALVPGSGTTGIELGFPFHLGRARFTREGHRVEPAPLDIGRSELAGQIPRFQPRRAACHHPKPHRKNDYRSDLHAGNVTAPNPRVDRNRNRSIAPKPAPSSGPLDSSCRSGNALGCWIRAILSCFRAA